MDVNERKWLHRSVFIPVHSRPFTVGLGGWGDRSLLNVDHIIVRHLFPSDTHRTIPFYSRLVFFGVGEIGVY